MSTIPTCSANAYIEHTDPIVMRITREQIRELIEEWREALELLKDV